MRFNQILVLALTATLTFPVAARNILSEQNEAANARDAYGDAINRVSDLKKRIQSQQELIAKEQARLQALQTDEAKAQADLEHSKTLFEQKSKVLDDAWKQRKDY